jgi:hypothetical protein
LGGEPQTVGGKLKTISGSQRAPLKFAHSPDWMKVARLTRRIDDQKKAMAARQ